jgi:hypothetical protein
MRAARPSLIAVSCTPDVWRLCSGQIPDVDRIIACLRQNTLQFRWLPRGPTLRFCRRNSNSPCRADELRTNTGGLRFLVSAQRYRLQVPFRASVSGGKDPVPNSKRAGLRGDR